MKDFDRLANCLLTGKAYFGSALAALQGPPVRHKYFLPTARLLCERFDEPIRILEIGSWAGASTVSWINAFLSLGRRISADCVDKWEPYFDLTLEQAAHYRLMNDAAQALEIYPLFLHNLKAAGIIDLVTIRKGSSKEILPLLEAKAFHLIYVDGSHIYSDVLSDIKEVKRLVVDGGIICGDDLEIQATDVPAHKLAQALKSQRDYVGVDGDPRSFHPGVTAAVSEELGRVSAWEGYWAIRWERGKVKKIVLDLSEAKLPDHIQLAVDRQNVVRLIEEDDKFRILEMGDRYIAVAISLDPEMISDTVSFEMDIPPVIFVDDSLIDLRNRLAVMQRTSSMQTPNHSVDDGSPILIRTVGEFNLISFKGQVIGIHISSGPIDVREGFPSILERMGPDKVVVGASEDGVLCGIALLKKIRDSEDRQVKIGELLGSSITEAVGTLNAVVSQLKAHHAENADMLGARITVTEAALRKDLQQSEARQAKSAESLASCFDTLNRSVDQLEARQAEAADTLGVRITVTEAALRKDLQQSEARHAKSAESLGSRINEAFGTMKESVEQLEARQKGNSEMLGSRIAALEEALRNDLEQSEVRLANNANLLGSRITEVVRLLNKSVEQLEANQARNIDKLGARIAANDAALKTSLRQSEVRQSESIEFLRQHVAEGARILTDLTHSFVGKLLLPTDKSRK